MKTPVHRPLLPFDSMSGLNCRLYWAYNGPVRNTFLNTFTVPWPSAAWFMQEGKVELRDSDRQRYSATKGQWIFSGDQVLRQSFTENSRLISIRYSIAWRSGQLLFTEKHPLILSGKKFPKLEQASLALVAKIERHLGKADTELGATKESLGAHFAIMDEFHRWCHCQVMTMLEAGLQPSLPNEADPRIETALSRLQDHPFVLPWREKELARFCGLSVSQLNRLFVRQLGKTPLQYYQERRFNAAQSALQKESTDIKMVAYELGFSSPSNFTTWFKKFSGLSPRDWRKKFLSQGPM